MTAPDERGICGKVIARAVGRSSSDIVQTPNRSPALRAGIGGNQSDAHRDPYGWP